MRSRRVSAANLEPWKGAALTGRNTGLQSRFGAQSKGERSRRVSAANLEPWKGTALTGRNTGLQSRFGAQNEIHGRVFNKTRRIKT